MDFGQIVLLCCALPMIILIIVGLFIVWNFSRFLRRLPEYTAPDTVELQKQYDALRAQHPQATQQQLVERIINQYALRQGIVGALTSVGGFLALPFGLVIDLAYSAQSNASLSYFIAQTYGIRDENKTLNVSQLLALVQRKFSPDDLVMWQEQLAGAAYRQLMSVVLRKTLAKFIPGAGLIIGFAVNWSAAQLFGRVANSYYAGNIGRLLGRTGSDQASG